MATIELYCDRCEADRGFEQPACEDGHGAECPEWCCTGCGAALLIGFPVVAAPRRGRRPGHRQGRAA